MFVRNFLICLSHNISKDIEFKFAVKIMAPNFVLVLYAFPQVREFLGHLTTYQPVRENPSVRSFLLVWAPKFQGSSLLFYVVSFVSWLHSSFLLAWFPSTFLSFGVSVPYAHGESKSHSDRLWNNQVEKELWPVFACLVSPSLISLPEHWSCSLERACLGCHVPRSLGNTT